jgi:8-oxo-dGTP diphosphatase
LFEYNARPLPGEFLASASCHNREELNQAEKLQLDFAVLSPVKLTASHPLREPMGWDRLEQLVRGYKLPVYALGGMSLEDVPLARKYGAQGVAVLGAAWNPR